MALTAREPSQDLIDLVGTLGGSWHGRTAMCLCPAHADTTPSLSLRQGDRGILVTCFAGCNREDVLRELRRVPIRRRFTYADAPLPRAGNAERIWEEAHPVGNTLAHRYLTARHLWPTTQDVRFHPRCAFRPKPHTQYLPALLIAVRQGRRLTAIQRILLDPITASCRMKLMLGRPAHGAWQGNIPDTAGQGGDVLALAEGFETARAFSLLRSIPCWSPLGARRFDQVQLPDRLSHLLLAHDNDAEGRRAAERAERRYARAGLIIERAPPNLPFNDWAEVLDSRAAARA